MPWPKGMPASPASIAKRTATLLANGTRRKKPTIVDGVELWRCADCAADLPASSFYASKKNANRLHSQCKACHTACSLRTRDKDAARAACAKYMRAARRSDPAKFRARDAAKPPPDPIKSKARALLNSAVRSRHLTRPDACSRCGQAGRIAGHHHDYARPLDVEWLCDPCHGKAHRHA